MYPQSSVPGVVFKDIPGFLGYCAGSDGTIWSRWGKGKHYPYPTREWQIRRPRVNEDGYCVLVMFRDYKRLQTMVHHLILAAFVGPRPDGMVTRHLNGDGQDNRIENLRWGTPKENSQDMVAHGHSQRGSKNLKSKLSDEQVIEIYKRLTCGERGADLAREYGITKEVVSSIWRGKSWAWLTGATTG